MSVIELVVFDMVGTTIEDRGQVIEAFRSSLHDHGIAVTDAELQPWRGASKRDVIRFYVQQREPGDGRPVAAQVEQVYAGFRRHLERSFLEAGTRALPGAEATFAWLRERDIRVALTTGFDRRLADVILRSVGWQEGAIDISLSSDQVRTGRPAPYMIFHAMEALGVMDVRRVLKVGDTAMDLLAGANAGVRGVVGVLSGSQGIDHLGRVEHTHIIPSVAELPALIDSAFR
jgi:phosphonatase-like hydrolase